MSLDLDQQTNKQKTDEQPNINTKKHNNTKDTDPAKKTKTPERENNNNQ